jgi:thymidylate kinase
MYKPFFIALEGVDGSGKTTTATLLAERLNAVYVKTPSKNYQHIWEHFDQQSKSNLARFFFYVTSLSEAATGIQRHLDEGDSVVVDRWTTSTLLYHEQLLGEDLSSVLSGVHLPRPDFCFILQPTLSTIFDRLNKRKRRHDSLLEHDKRFMSMMYEKYKSINNAIHIDPGQNSVNEVVNRIMQSYLRLEPIKEACYA